MTKEKKEQLITRWQKDIVKGGFDNYKDWRYITKKVRVGLGIKYVRRIKRIPEFLIYEEIKILLKTAYNLQVVKSHKSGMMKGLILETILKSGVRNSELCNLRVENLDFINNIFKVVQGKGSKDRMGFMPSSIMSKLQLYLEGRESGFLFINERGRQFRPRSIQLIMKEIKKLSKINKDITPHSLRHTFATILINEGVDIAKIQRLLGHEDIKTTQIYTHVLMNDMKEEVLKVTDKMN